MSIVRPQVPDITVDEQLLAGVNVDYAINVFAESQGEPDLTSTERLAVVGMAAGVLVTDETLLTLRQGIFIDGQMARGNANDDVIKRLKEAKEALQVADPMRARNIGLYAVYFLLRQEIETARKQAALHQQATGVTS